ncbi:glutamate--tRNA ligase family protein [Sulfurimonas sp.]|uniref:glutamate--tRNA ligase family protein n=1 Tax=Sulfurimonas sp. TaxID=2022749 RepID=UPI00262EAB1B|nr:glutamate--tRNA ligase family protein [Sulfurimonas sp.]
MLRFAFRPTDDMNIEELRVALFNSILSKQKNEDFIVRIDDIDKENLVESKEQETLGLLSLFGIEYSQVLHETQNVRFHSAMALDLLHKKKAFSCFCSDDWLDKKREEAKEKNEEYYYDDACRNLPAELVIDNTAPFTVRIARPDKPIMNFEPDSVDSFIIMNRDKTPTANFAAAVDDMLSDISAIVSQNKDRNDTAKQMHVRDALGYEKEIEYTYLPAIESEKSISIKELLEEGYLPEAISNYIISLTINTPKEIFTLNEVQEWFSVENISDSSTLFDIEMLKHINQEHLKMMDAKELSRYVGFADADIGELAKVYVKNISTTKELKAKIAPIFEQKEIPEEFTQQILSIKESIQKAPYFEEYDDFKKYLMNDTGLQEEDFLKPLSILLTNADDASDLSTIYKYLKNYLGEIIK